MTTLNERQISLEGGEMSIVPEQQIAFQKAICDAIGVNPDVTCDIYIDIQAGDIARVHIWQVVSRETGEKVKRVFKLAAWQERE